MFARLRRFWRILQIEYDVSYPFPALVGMFAISLFLAAYPVFSKWYDTVDVIVSSGPFWNGTSQVLTLQEITQNADITLYSASMLNMVYVIIIIVPLLVAFNVGLGFKSGQIRTLLSYPIGRRRLLSSRILMIILTVAGSTNLAVITAFMFYSSMIQNIGMIILMSIALWITVILVVLVCTTVALVTKSAPVTAMLGLSFWLVAFIQFTIPANPQAIRVLFPILINIRYLDIPFTFQYLPEVSLLEVFILTGIAGIIALVLFILSMLLFERIEV